VDRLRRPFMLVAVLLGAISMGCGGSEGTMGPIVVPSGIHVEPFAYLMVEPTDRAVSSTSGSTTFTVSNAGSKTMYWGATESSDWVTLTNFTGVDDGLIRAIYDSNTTSSARTCTITVSVPDGGAGDPKEVTITQEAPTTAP
jgi:hypothetical protein